MPEDDMQEFNAVGQLTSEHEAVLQTLDADVNGFYMPLKSFEASLKDWEGIPIIYGQRHPNLKKLMENMSLALQEVDAVEVGHISEPNIDKVGHPKLRATANFTKMSEELTKYIHEGKLSLSTGFLAKLTEDGVENVKPNHVLVFLEDRENVPGDRGSGFLNKKNVLKDIFRQLQILFESKEIKEDVTMANKEEDTIHEKEIDEDKYLDVGTTYCPACEEIHEKEIDEDKYLSEISDLKEQLNKANGKIAEYEKIEKERLEEVKNKQWKEILEILPAGMTKPEGAADKLREQWEADPTAFSVTMLKTKVKVPEDEEGEEFVHKKEMDDELEAASELEHMFT
jgi:hypothetical protein